MAIYDIYSKRQRKLRGDVPDVYIYDDIPHALRAQIVYIIGDAIGTSPRGSRDDETGKFYAIINDVLCREYGVMGLPNADGNPYYQGKITNFFLSVKECDKALDVVEVAFNLVQDLRENNALWWNRQFLATFEENCNELNHRFREHGIGYQFESGEIIRVDSQLIHNEVVKPALLMLNDPMYEGANEEFLKAHEHYRHKNYKECLNECLKAFESTMKSICDKRGWAYDASANSSRLITVCFDNGLIPSFLQTQFNSLKSTLESGVPTARNKLGGHGQGAQTVNVPEYLASYTLHLTATNILLLAKAEEDLP